MLFPTRKIADACRAFMVERSSQQGSPIAVRLVQFFISPESASASTAAGVELHIVLFPAGSFPLAKQFWQHTGLGISSRLAEQCLAMLPEEGVSNDRAKTPPPRAIPSKKMAGNRHYAKAPSFSSSPPCTSVVPERSLTEILETDHVEYLEERYGRNMPVGAAAAAKRAMRRRIAGVLVKDTPSDWSSAGGQEAELGPSTRGVKEVNEDDVYLYPTGMAAIWSSHQLALGVMPLAKSICFG